MLIIWGVLGGMVLGAFWPGSNDFTYGVGVIFGLIAGVSLRWAVRREMRGELAVTEKRIKSELLIQLKALGAAGTGTSTGTGIDAATEASFTAVTTAPQRRQEAPGGPLNNERDTGAFTPSAAALAGATPFAVRQPNFTGQTQANASAGATPEKSKQPLVLPPNAIELALTESLEFAKGWLLGGNTIVRVGLVILFIGLSFLARYAAVSGLLPVEFRLAAIAAVGIALLVFGFKKRDAKPGFALALQGAGVAVMYLTVFAAFKLYALLPALPAFGLMLVVCALSCALALLQNARSLAVVAFGGGFAVPLLLSTGQGSHVSLFSYYTVLNVAILFIAYKRSWRILNLVGFIATFGVATLWGALTYTPENYASTQPFLIGFVLIYLLTAVLYARNTPTQLGRAVDSTLVFGTPLAGFGLQAGLVQPFELGTALSALGFGAVYLVLAAVLQRRATSNNYRLLVECFIAIGVGFATLAVPLGLDARWTSAVWALEGAGAFWVGMRQARWMPRAFGLVLQLVAALAFVDAVGANVSVWPFANAAFLGALLIALPALLMAWWLRAELPHSGSSWAKGYAVLEAQAAVPMYLYGFAFWCAAWLLEINRQVAVTNAQGYPTTVPVFSDSTSQLLGMLAVLGSAALSQRLGLAKSWAVATWPSRLTLAMMAWTLLAQIVSGHSVLDTPAWLVWPPALGLHFWLLRQNGMAPSAALRNWNHAIHVGGAWLVTLLLADCLWFFIGKGDLLGSAWASVVMLMSAIAVLMLLATWAGRANADADLKHFKWPLQPHASSYYWTAAVPLAVLVFFGALAVAVHSSGRTAPLPYIPLLNPTDLAIALALGGLVFWRRAVVSSVPLLPGSSWVCGRNALVAVAGLGFVAINTVWLRVAHHFFAVPWQADALFGSFVVQTGYAILWTLLALSVMLLAHRRLQRTLWLAGAALLGLTVLKLLLVDLSNVGGVERIVVFIAVGMLMLVVGYFAPLPPKLQPFPAPKVPAVPSPEATSPPDVSLLSANLNKSAV